MKYTKVTKENLHELYNRPDGNIYYSEIYDGKTYYDITEGFTEEDIRVNLEEGYSDIDFIFIEGPSLGIKVDIFN